MHDRWAAFGPLAAVAGVLGICCGLPVLLSVGVVGAFAGWSLQSWTLIGLGMVLAVAGAVRIARRRRTDRACPRPESGSPRGTTPSHDSDLTNRSDTP